MIEESYLSLSMDMTETDSSVITLYIYTQSSYMPTEHFAELVSLANSSEVSAATRSLQTRSSSRRRIQT